MAYYNNTFTEQQYEKPHAQGAGGSGDWVNNFNFFETGYIMIDGHRYDVEDISINASRDMTPYHVAAQRDPIDQRPGKNKIDFSMKRAFSDATLAHMYDQCCIFDLLLINNDDPNAIQPVVLLTGCRFTQDNIGPVNGSDVVSEDLQGVATRRIWEMCEIKNALRKQCAVTCPDTTGVVSDAVNQDLANIGGTAYNILNAGTHGLLGAVWNNPQNLR